MLRPAPGKARLEHRPQDRISLNAPVEGFHHQRQKIGINANRRHVGSRLFLHGGAVCGVGAKIFVHGILLCRLHRAKGAQRQMRHMRALDDIARPRLDPAPHGFYNLEQF